MYSLKQTVAPTEEPVSVGEARRFMRVDGTDEDLMIRDFIRTATQRAETITNRQLMTATLRARFDRFQVSAVPELMTRDGKAIELPAAPLVSVTSIQYVDTDGATQTWSASNYVVATDHEPGRVTRAYSVEWPTVRDIADAVTITYVAGYASALLVPEIAKTAIRIGVRGMYDKRDDADILDAMTAILADLIVPNMV